VVEDKFKKIPQLVWFFSWFFSSHYPYFHLNGCPKC